MSTDAVRNTVDITAAGIAVGTLLQALPHIAAALTVIWCAYRVYEIRLSIREKKLRLERLEAGHAEP